MRSTLFFEFPFFLRLVFVHQKPTALRPSFSIAENLPEESRLLYPKGETDRKTKNSRSWNKVEMLFKSLLKFALLGLPESERKWFAVCRGAEPSASVLVQNQPFLQRDTNSALWTET